MNFEQFIYSLSDTGAISLENIIFRFLIATILGVLISLISYITYRGRNDNSIFSAQIILTMTSSVIIIVIGNNIARAFAIMGALNLVRFSARIASPKDNALIFFCIVIGMTCGSGYIIIALIGVLFLAIILIILKITGLFHNIYCYVEFEIKDIIDAKNIIEENFNNENIKYKLIKVNKAKIEYKIKKNIDDLLFLLNKIIDRYSNIVKEFSIREEREIVND